MIWKNPLAGRIAWLNNRLMNPNASTRRKPDTNGKPETFVGEGLTPVDQSFAVAAMATGQPGLPQSFSWKGGRFIIREVLAEWKGTGDCRHGSGERYVRKHWFHVRTTDGAELKLYFERQPRTRGGSRWRLFSMRTAGAEQFDS